MPALAPTSTPEGEWLRALRQTRGLTQTGLAEVLGVRQPTISKVEGGERGITPELGWRLLMRADVPVDEISEFVDLRGYLMPVAA